MSFINIKNNIPHGYAILLSEPQFDLNKDLPLEKLK